MPMQEPLQVQHGSKNTYATKAQLETLVLWMHRTGILYSEALEEFRRQFILVVLREVPHGKSRGPSR